MSLKLACPRCRHVQFFDDALAGQPVTCAKCAQMFRVPRPADADAGRASDATASDATASGMTASGTPGMAAASAAANAPWPWPEQLAPRELPATFAPPDLPAVKVVPLPDDDAARGRKRSSLADDDSDPETATRGTATATAEPFRRGPRPGGRTRITRDEPSQLPWVSGVAIIALVMILFVGAAVWFVSRDHHPPPKVVFAPRPQPQPFQPQPFQPQPLPRPGKFRPMPGPGMLGMRQWQMLQKGMDVPVAPQPNEQFIAAKLNHGILRQPGAIQFTDPHHPLNPGHHRKVYLIDLEPDRNYTIELNMDPPRKLMRNFKQFVNLDPFLLIEDSKGKLLDFNDDINEGFELDSRIQIRVPAKGTYRIECTSFAPNETGKFILNIRDEDMGKPVAAKKLPQRQLPQPAETKQALAVEKTVKRNLQITTIFASDDPLVGDLCWTADAAAFFVLDKNGTLRRIAWPDNVEERKLELAQPASSLTMSRLGLLVSLPQLDEVWLIDTESLQVTKRISAPGLVHVTAAPATDIAIAATRQPANPLPRDVLMVLDVAKGVAVRQYDNYAHYSPRHAAMTPDGNYLFTEGGVEQLMRYRVRGDEIVLEEESPRLAAKGTGVFISPDGKHVCLPSPGGNYATDPAVRVEPFTTLIFPAGNLRKPAFSINTGEAPGAVGFDPKSGNVFAHSNDKQFMLFRETGFKSREVNLPGADQFSGQPRQFLTHPAGFQVLVRTEHTIYGVELPRDDEKK